MIIFRVQMETSSLQGSTAACDVQGWAPAVGRTLPFTDGHPLGHPRCSGDAVHQVQRFLLTRGI